MQLLVTGPDASKRKLDLQEKPVTVGRASDNVLPYPNDPALSRYHLAIEPVEGGWQARDCGSRNGTVVNATVLSRPKILRPGDRIYAGQLTLELVKASTSISGRVVTFLPTDKEGKDKRGSTIVTSLEEVLDKARGEKAGKGKEDSSLSNSRAVTALIRAGQELAGHRPLNDLFEVILDLALSAVTARRGVILTEDADGELTVRASRGEDFLLSSSVRDQVVRQRAALLIRDAQFDIALKNQQSIVAQQVRSIVAVPLQTNERVIGLIYVDNATTLRPFSQEDLELLTVMANVAAIRIEHARLALIEQQEKITQLELEQASEIQQGLLPEGPPELPGFEVAGYNLPCRTVGGDYYDFLPHPEGRFGLCIADVCGKGLPAALMMSSLQARVQMLAESAPEPGRALTVLNKSLAPRFPMGKFITCFYGVLNPATGHLSYANAGHNYPLILRANGEVERVKGGAIVLALQPNVEYTEREITLNVGDTLLLYSDGVTEAPGPGGEHFGENRLSDFLRLCGNAPCQDFIRLLADAVRAWSGGAAFNDDFTVVLLRRTG